MNRREFLSSAGAAAVTASLPAPALAQPAKARTMTFVPQAALTFLDSSFTSTVTSTTHGGN